MLQVPVLELALPEWPQIPRAGVGVASTGVADGELSGFGDGDGLAFALLVLAGDDWRNRCRRGRLFPVYFLYSLSLCQRCVQWPVHHVLRFRPWLLHHVQSSAPF